MIRTIIMLLLLAVFFLSGTLYGMNQTATSTSAEGNNEDNGSVSIKEEVVNIVPEVHEPVEREEELVPAPVVEQDLIAMDNRTHLTQKTASVLETSVQGFYEVVVGVLYGVAEIFF